MPVILHISDLHYYRPQWSSLAQCAKTMLAPHLRTYANFALNPNRWYRNHLLPSLATFVNELPEHQRPSLLLNTGDLTATGNTQELHAANHATTVFRSQLSNPSIPAVTLPGNHDVYHQRSEKGIEQITASWLSKSESKDFYKTRVHTINIDDHWELITLDLSPDKALGKAFGAFDEKTKKKLLDTVRHLSHKNIILAAHWPFHAMHNKNNELIGKESLRDICHRHKNIYGYFHGHTHIPSIINQTDNHGNSCLTAEPGPFGARAFPWQRAGTLFSKNATIASRAHLIELSDKQLCVTPIIYDVSLKHFTLSIPSIAPIQQLPTHESFP